jgi:23S rRNA G2069 N7-methylase RlmK/C1962 C5-methylase RlmI
MEEDVRPRYNVMVEAYAGIHVLRPYPLAWERHWHTITWSMEDTREEAEAMLATIVVDDRWCRAKWIEEIL